jgi:solute carrier family 35 protein E1
VAFYVAVWYVGNILYIKYNDEAKVAFSVPIMGCKDPKKSCNPKDYVKVGSDVSAWAMSVATGQLLVGFLYAAYLWVAPGCRKMPALTTAQWIKAAPAGACSALAHASSVFALSVGGIAFGSIVKAAEPVFSAAVNSIVYKHGVSTGKLACMLPIVGGIAIASLKFGADFKPVIDKDFFSVPGLLFACAANVFAAFKGAESKKAKAELKGIDETNVFAIFGIISLLVSIPLMLYKESSNPGGMAALVNIVQTGPNALRSLVLSGFTFYLYNECAFMALKGDKNPDDPRLDPVLSSVANTAKRVVVIYYGALINGKELTQPQIVGCSICILGVGLYSVIDDLLKPKEKAH